MPRSVRPGNSSSFGGPPRCLMVTKEFAAEPTSGGTLRTLAIVQQLSTHYDTTVISPSGVYVQGPGKPLTRQTVTVSGISGRLPWSRLHAASRYGSISGIRTAGGRLLDNLRAGAQGRYEAGVIDHTCLAGLAEDVAVGCDRLVISMHNIESDLMAQRCASADSAVARLAMRAETALLRRLERAVTAHYPVLVCTAADARALGESTAIVCRNGIFAPSSSVVPQTSRRRGSIVFTGALDWEPNVTGLTWFARRVWPQVRQRIPEATLTVAGRKPGAEVVAACREPGIRLAADPPVMADVLAGQQLGVVPLLSGGGSRIKILEYLVAGLDIVSTDVGASGLEDVPGRLLDRVPGQPQLLADALVNRLESPRDSGIQAQDWVVKNYSWEITLRPMLDLLAG